MSNTKQNDDLTPEEIKDIDEFYANAEDRLHFKTPEKLIQWLKDD